MEMIKVSPTILLANIPEELPVDIRQFLVERHVRGGVFSQDVEVLSINVLRVDLGSSVLIQDVVC